MSNLFEGYDGFNNVEKSEEHIIAVSKNNIGICDLNKNCSSLELKISDLNRDGDLTINSVQSNKINIRPNNNLVENFSNLYISNELLFVLLIIIILIYFLKK